MQDIFKNINFEMSQRVELKNNLFDLPFTAAGI